MSPEDPSKSKTQITDLKEKLEEAKVSLTNMRFQIQIQEAIVKKLMEMNR